MGSGEDDFFLRILPYKGVAAMLVMWPGCLNKFLFPTSLEATYEIWLQLA